jgi:hypothetical protein
MNLNKRQPSGREKDEAAINLLARLREKLHSDNSSIARRSAFNLSWMQEDGLEILKETLFSRATRRAKSAAAYGLRKMHGRMRKAALEVFKDGLEHPNYDTKVTCHAALSQLGIAEKKETPSQKMAEPPGIRIQEIPPKARQTRRAPILDTKEHLSPHIGHSQRRQLPRRK